jgi:UDP-N-acetylglucosamine 3-dehydrogenase
MGAQRVILVGAGRMGRNHLRVLSENRNFQVAAVVDPAVEELFPNETGFVRARTLEELGNLAYDCAVVAAPTSLHAEFAHELLGRRKAFLMEKPLAATPAQCEEIVAIAEERDVKIGVGHLERFNPAVRKLATVIKSGWLGRPIHFSFTRVGGYPEVLLGVNNVLLDLAVHDLDVLRSLAGPSKVVATVCHSAWRPGVFDTAEILLSAEGGFSASIHVNWVTPTKIRTVRVTGTHGVCFVDYILQTCTLFGGNLLRRTAAEGFDFNSLAEEYKSTDRVEFGIVKQEPLRVQLDQFHNLLSGKPSEICTPRDAAACVRLADDALREAQRLYHERLSEPPRAPDSSQA